MKSILKWLRWRGVLTLAALTPPCRQIVQLASRDLDQPLSSWTRWRVRVHLRICAACERYLRQLEVLREAAGKSGAELPETSSAKLAADAKERLKQRLRCERVGRP